jgi:hypothetical protein
MHFDLARAETGRVALKATALAFAATLAVAHGGQARAAGPNGGGASGVITIDQAKAEAGGVTGGDASGFPVTISQPGSYRLMSNLTVTDPNVHAIHITADNVTLDLNGFTIQGVVSCTGTGASYTCTPANTWGNHGVEGFGKSLATVRNGMIRGFARGVQVGKHARVEELQVSSSGGFGIVTESYSLVMRNVVSGAISGISATSSVVRDNSIFNVRNSGISAMGASLIAGNSVAVSGGIGIGASGNQGTAGLVNNVIKYTASNPINPGVSLGDGQTNLCEDVKC